jgi:hypothetical protein
MVSGGKQLLYVRKRGRASGLGRELRAEDKRCFLEEFLSVK